MMKRYRLNKVISKRCYSTEEIANCFGIHIQTIRTWHRNGLKAIDEDSLPFLFLGSNIKKYISQEQSKNKVKLKEGEMYCLKCKKGVVPINSHQVDRKKLIGKGKHSIFIVGECPSCSKVLNRFSTLENEIKSNSANTLIVTARNESEQLKTF